MATDCRARIPVMWPQYSLTPTLVYSEPLRSGQRTTLLQHRTILSNPKKSSNVWNKWRFLTRLADTLVRVEHDYMTSTVRIVASFVGLLDSTNTQWIYEVSHWKIIQSARRNSSRNMQKINVKYVKKVRSYLSNIFYFLYCRYSEFKDHVLL